MIDPSDPRLTAYALGEMSLTERAAFEAELTSSPELFAEVAEISNAAVALRRELATSAPKALEQEQRSAIEQAMTPGGNVVRLEKKRSSLWLGVPLAIAACVGGVVILGSMTGSDRSESKDGFNPPSFPESVGDAKKRFKSAASAAAAPMATATAMARAEDAWKDVKRKVAEEEQAPSPQGTFSANEPLPENPFFNPATEPQSTFSIDVDTASYAMIRRTIQSRQKPAASNVRIEEMVNYFSYSYPEPDDAAFSVNADTAEAPWDGSHRLVRIGLKGKKVQMSKRPASNLVFLLDTSGSMNGADRLPLVKKSMALLVEQLDERDSVSIVAYAGSSGLVLPPTPGNERQKIIAAFDNLAAGGSTNGGQGIKLAYETAAKQFIQGGTNRVILATDGDFNVGVTGKGALEELIQQKAKTGVFLSVLGFGVGNTKDATMETLADKGNGNYAYIDGIAEAKKVLVDQMGGTLITVAKDVKIQVSFDPKTVQSYRLIGYENRVMAHEDFNNDKKDAGEIGADHRVTALYDVVPVKGAGKGSRYAKIALRYKQPDGVTSRLVESTVEDSGVSFDSASTDFRFAASVAGFGMLLKGSKYKGDLSYDQIATMANASVGDDPDGHRKELVSLVRSMKEL